MKRYHWLLEICIALLVLLFLYTALSKWLDFRHYVRAINNQPFDNKYTPVLVFALPGIELLAVILILINHTRILGLWLSVALMIIFTIYVGLVTFHFYDRVPCACGGVFQQLGWTEHLIFNIVFTGIAVTALYFQTLINVEKSSQN